VGSSISVRRNGKAAILDVAGDIDLASSPEMRRVLLLEVRENRTPKVICNLSGVNYIDSSGIASFVEGLKASRDIGSRLILFGLTSTAREVLQLSRLLNVFEIYESENEALRS
jgi:anti-sigma B factor antagonist